MSEENVALVQAATDAYNQSGLDALLEYWADDIDYRPAERAIDDRGAMHGKDAVRAYIEDWLDTFEELRNDPVELIDVGEDRVVTVQRISGRAKASGIETNMTYAALYTIRDGKIVRAREYWTKEEALEAAGLSE